MASILTNDFKVMIADLPAKSDLALIHLYDKIREWQSTPQQDDDENTIKLFCRFVREYVKRKEIDIELPEYDYDSDVGNLLHALQNFKELHENKILKLEIEEIVNSIIESQEEESFGFAFLNHSEKTRIHENLTRIRKLVAEANLSVRKKNAIFDRLNKLAEEVDKTGTRTDRFFAFMGDAAFLLGDMAQKAKPFTDEVKDMIKIVGKARSRQEGTILPPSEEVLSLPAATQEIKSDQAMK